MGWPEGENRQVVIRPLATNSPQNVGAIENVELLGYGKVESKRDEEGLKISLPAQKPGEHAFTFRISGKGLV